MRDRITSLPDWSKIQLIPEREAIRKEEGAEREIGPLTG